MHFWLNKTFNIIVNASFSEKDEIFYL